MRIRVCALASIAIVALGSVVNAHFIWLKSLSSDDGQVAVMQFSKSPHVDSDRVPEKVLDAKLTLRKSKGKPLPLKTRFIETGDTAYLATTVEGRAYTVETTCTYGLYHGALLTYYAQYLHIDRPQQLAKLGPSKDHQLDISPAVDGDTLSVTIRWNQKPKSNLEVVVQDDIGNESDFYTDDEGRAKFPKDLHGLLGIRTHFIEEDKKGQWQGEAYSSAMHYSTLTLQWPPTSEQEKPAKSQIGDIGEITDVTLAQPVSSFGAVVHGDYLYVYSGHIGIAHEHSHKNLSRQFRRYHFKHRKWEDLELTDALQGLALVGHGKYIYRIGGMAARNAPGEEADLHSTNTAARFDTESKKWHDLPNLPRGRSSHDAVVVGDDLYVIGGWELSGSERGRWHKEALVLDLAAQTLRWQELPKHKSVRRALAAATQNGLVYALCGMNEGNEIDRGVDVFDPKTRQWTSGPEFPGEGMNGFGIAAWNFGGQIHASGSNGIVYRLDSNGERWEALGKLHSPRFFHRLVPSGTNGLLAVGGASLEVGHLDTVEQIELK